MSDDDSKLALPDLEGGAMPPGGGSRSTPRTPRS